MPWKISNDGYKFHKKVAIFDAFLFDDRSILINFFFFSKYYLLTRISCVNQLYSDFRKCVVIFESIDFTMSLVELVIMNHITHIPLIKISSFLLILIHYELLTHSNVKSKKRTISLQLSFYSITRVWSEIIICNYHFCAK